MLSSTMPTMPAAPIVATLPVTPESQHDRESAYRMGTVASYALAVERVIQAMRAQLAEPLSLEEMAEIACLSPFHFNRVFRSITNIPPGEFLAVQRLDAAKRLLLTTSLSVTDVCFELGYTSLGTFTTRFKQLAGMSPLQLRQLAGVLAFTTVNPRYAGYPGAQRLTFLRDGGVYGVRGSITAPGPLSGLIFIGLSQANSAGPSTGLYCASRAWRFSYPSSPRWTLLPFRRRAATIATRPRLSGTHQRAARGEIQPSGDRAGWSSAWCGSACATPATSDRPAGAGAAAAAGDSHRRDYERYEPAFLSMSSGAR